MLRTNRGLILNGPLFSKSRFIKRAGLTKGKYIIIMICLQMFLQKIWPINDLKIVIKLNRTYFFNFFFLKMDLKMASISNILRQSVESAESFQLYEANY